MKIAQPVLALVVVAVMSCQSSLQDIATPAPTAAHAKVSGKSLPVLKRGYGIYMRQCAQCHEHRLPNTTTLPAWHAQVNTMSTLAGLGKSEEEALQIYLSEFSDR